MFRQLAQTWRTAAPQGIRRYSKRVGYSVEELESEPVPLTRQVWEIVHPSQHTQLHKTRTVSQSVGSDENLGLALAADARRQQAAAHDRLHALYASAQEETTHLTREEYAAFLEGFNDMSDVGMCVRVLRDMRESMVQVRSAQFGMVLKAAADAFQAHAVFEVGEEMRRAGAVDFEGFFNSLLRCLGQSGQIEHAYSVYEEMLQKKVGVLAPGYAALITGLARFDEVALALRVMKEALARGTALTQDVYAALLHGAGERMHHEAYAFAFSQLTSVFGAQLPEGDCLAGLDVAARAGDTTLATSIIEQLQRGGCPLEEMHFEPLLVAVLANAQWTPALRVLSMMRQSGYGVGQATLRPLERALAKAEQPEQMAEAVFAAVAASRDALPLVADHVTLNALVAGLAQSGCVEAAESRLTTWFTQLNVERTDGSYAAVIEACVARRNKTVAERVLMQLIDQGLTPSLRVYEAMLHISLVQPNYEDAFVYLEAMKAHAMVPSWRTLAAVVRRCARVRDVRAQTAIKEMRRLGMVVTPTLASFAHYAGRSPRATPVKKLDTSLDESNEDSEPVSNEESKPESGKESKPTEPTLSDLFGTDTFRL
ncbi:hypothetical protein GGF43_002877 [Coemansia sp. RSA 2618]|nr:hypothetical protein GGF43_002877 [Coemansia sp. RSA 2618]